MKIMQKVCLTVLIISRILAGIFRRLILHQNSADIRPSRTFYGGFSAASTILADMANFRQLGSLVGDGDSNYGNGVGMGTTSVGTGMNFKAVGMGWGRGV